jgi:hypothetical protein
LALARTAARRQRSSTSEFGAGGVNDLVDLGVGKSPPIGTNGTGTGRLPVVFGHEKASADYAAIR